MKKIVTKDYVWALASDGTALLTDMTSGKSAPIRFTKQHLEQTIAQMQTQQSTNLLERYTDGLKLFSKTSK